MHLIWRRALRSSAVGCPALCVFLPYPKRLLQLSSWLEAPSRSAAIPRFGLQHSLANLYISCFSYAPIKLQRSCWVVGSSLPQSIFRTLQDPGCCPWPKFCMKVFDGFLALDPQFASVAECITKDSLSCVSGLTTTLACHVMLRSLASSKSSVLVSNFVMCVADHCDCRPSSPHGYTWSTNAGHRNSPYKCKTVVCWELGKEKHTN